MKRYLLLSMLPFLVAWDNPLEGTIYDRDIEGIPRAAWIHIGQLMSCVHDNEVLLGSDVMPVTTAELRMVREILHDSVRLLRRGRIGRGTDLIDLATTEMRNVSKIDCPTKVILR